MDKSIVDIVRRKDRVARHYSRLCKNDEVEIVHWLQQRGFSFDMVSGVEDHDIGDQDYFSGCISSNDIDEIAAFFERLYGRWTILSSYQGIEIEIKKPYPNIMHGLSFQYPRTIEDALAQVFSEFEKNFCYPVITTSEEER